MPERAADVVEHETGLARFVIAPRRDRFIGSLSDERLRRKLGQRLAHHDADFDERFVVEVEQHSKAADFIDEVRQALVARGAPGACFILAPRHRLDGARVDLTEALIELIPYGPALISCIPGQLGAYFGESANPVLVLDRRSKITA